MKSLIVTPTYNEINNIGKLIKKISKYSSQSDILVIDDNSPDGTGTYIKELMFDNKNIHLIERTGKFGLGTAYIEGFKWALENDYECVIQIDADLSHDPKDIPTMIDALSTHDLIIGSRYINGVNVINWPMRRLLLSYFANIYSRIITGMPIKDSTGGYKCYNIDILNKLDLNDIRSEGYSFQIETTYHAWKKQYRIKEIPIIFHDRTVGQSKMTKNIIYEAVWVVIKLRLKSIFGMI